MTMAVVRASYDFRVPNRSVLFNVRPLTRTPDEV